MMDSAVDDVWFWRWSWRTNLITTLSFWQKCCMNCVIAFFVKMLLQQTSKTSFGTCVCVLWNIDQHCCIHQHEYEWRIADSSLNTHKLYASLTMSVHSDSLPTFQLSDRSLCSLCIHFCSRCHCLIGLLMCTAYARNSLANGGYLNWLHHRYGACTCVFFLLKYEHFSVFLLIRKCWVSCFYASAKLNLCLCQHWNLCIYLVAVACISALAWSLFHSSMNVFAK